MAKYNVNAYPILVVRIPGIEADSPEEAIARAEAAVDWQALERTVPNGAQWVQFGEDFDAWLVDPLGEDGEPDYDRSQWFDGLGRPVEEAANG